MPKTMFQRHFELYEGIDAKLVFQLAHPGQHPLIFHADSEHLASRYVYVCVGHFLLEIVKPCTLINFVVWHT